ncbi:MFS transporter [Vallitalea pronyensis]|uniref:MFS transporter n=1 Tax=Vallitalea pronyensis TaxID=1348613 RepID=A0A8J8MQ19_9FIRM|nr:MFS transporter [Vallitalea pronyensis]QUI25308.1 MFS transporter [Vallitalea pronyensis]
MTLIKKKHSNFILYLLGHNTSILGDIILMTGFALYIMKKTGSTMQFSITIAISFIPRILISPYAGVIVDRLNKKKMVILLDLIRGLWLMVLWYISLHAQLSIQSIYITLIFFSVCDCFFGPAFSTIYPRIVHKDFLSKGNAISNTITSITNTLSPLVASLIYTGWGLSILLLFDAMTFIISAFTEFNLYFEDVIVKKTGKIFFEFKEGIMMIKSNRRLRSLLLNGNLTHLFLFPFIEAGVVFLLFVMFKAPDVHYGIVRSCISGGAIFSGFIAIQYQKKKGIADNINRGIIWMIGAVALFMLLIFNGFRDILDTTEYFPVIYLSIVCFMVFFAFSFYGVFFRSFYQSEVSSTMLGRFISIMIMTFAVSRLVGMLVYGYLLEKGYLTTALVILFVGMMLKLVVHIPFLKAEKALD